MCYSVDSQIFLVALIHCLRVEYRNWMPPPGLSPVMLQYPQFRNFCLNTSHQSCLNLRQWPTGALESPIVITGGWAYCPLCLNLLALIYTLLQGQEQFTLLALLHHSIITKFLIGLVSSLETSETTRPKFSMQKRFVPIWKARVPMAFPSPHMHNNLLPTFRY